MGRKSPAAISAPGGERGASGTIIDITCHVNIGYRHRPLSTCRWKKGPPGRKLPDNRWRDNYVLVLEKGQAPVNSTLRATRAKRRPKTPRSFSLRITFPPLFSSLFASLCPPSPRFLHPIIYARRNSLLFPAKEEP